VYAYAVVSVDACAYKQGNWEIATHRRRYPCHGDRPHSWAEQHGADPCWAWIRPETRVYHDHILQVGLCFPHMLTCMSAAHAWQAAACKSFRY
jgi:hypothetical protein